MASSILAGSFCNIITNPIWVVRTRVMGQALRHQSQQYPSEKITQVLKSMVNNEGLRSLFKGVSASVMGVSNAVVFFFIYENLRERIIQSQGADFNGLYVLGSSIVSKCTKIDYLVTASTMTYPLLVTRTLMQDHRSTPTKQSLTFKETFQSVYRKKGILGFYAGLKPDLLRLLPSNSIVFLVY